ncbi:MAG: hypothetical protein AAB415_03280 [Patescibacteria group bacterium]
MTKLKRQIIALLTIVALLLPLVTAAQFNLPRTNRQKTPAQLLAETRKDDRRQCEAEVSSGTPSSIGHAITDPTAKSLKDTTRDGIGQALPKGVNRALAQNIPSGIERGIKKELPDMVTEGLKRELPLTLGEKIKAEMVRNDETFQAVVRSERFTGLLRDSIDESLPRIIQDGLHDRLPKIIDESVRIELPHALRLEFDKVAKPTIENHFRAQINTMIGEIPQMVVAEVQTLQATINGTISGLQAAAQSLAKKDPVTAILNVFALIGTFLVTGDWDAALNSIPEIAQMKGLIENLLAQIQATKDFIVWAGTLIANKEQLVNNLVDGFTLELSKSLTNPKSIARLADAIGEAMTDPINRSLDNAVEKIEASIERPLNNAINAINKFPDKFFDPINQAVDSISSLVNLEIEMIVHSVTNPIVSTIDVASDQIAGAIDGGISGVFGPLISDTGNLLGSVGSSIAFEMNTAAVQTHINIFGSEGLGIDQIDPTAEALWPNGETGLPEPPTYFPVSDELGFSGDELTVESESQLGPVFEASDEFAGVAAEETINSTEGVTNDAITETGKAAGLDPATGASLMPVMGASIAGIAGSMFKGIPIVGAQAAAFVTKFVAEKLASLGFGAAGAVLAVPVNEIGALLAVNQNTDSTTSKILQTSEQIKQMTEKIYSLQVQSCTYLKIAQRVQLALETKELLDDPNVRKANAEALHRAFVASVKDLNQGREISDGMNGVATDDAGNNKGSLIIGNLNDHMAEAGSEENLVVQAELKELEADSENYPYAKIARESLAAQDSEDPLRSTVSKTRIEDFRDRPESLDNQSWWETRTAIAEPKNNPFGQTLIAQGIRDQRVAVAEQAARDEYIAGRGYAGTRECPPELQVPHPVTGLPICANKNWQTLTPGSTIGSFNDRLAQAPIEQAAVSDELIEDSTKSEVGLSVKRVANLSNSSETVPHFDEIAAQSVFKQPDPCPGPGPCNQTGWPRIARPALPTLPVTPVVPPVLTAAFLFETPPTASLADPNVKNETIVTWASSQATACVTKNDWVLGPGNRNVKPAGTSVGIRGAVTVFHPVSFSTPPIFSRVVSAENLVGPILTRVEVPNNKLKQKLTFNPILASAIHPDDVYRLALGLDLFLEVGGPGLVNPPTPAQVIKLFRERISLVQGNEDTPVARELRKYDFTYIGDNTLVMSPKLYYELACARGGETIDKHFSIARQ